MADNVRRLGKTTALLLRRLGCRFPWGVQLLVIGLLTCDHFGKPGAASFLSLLFSAALMWLSFSIGYYFRQEYVKSPPVMAVSSAKEADEPVALPNIVLPHITFSERARFALENCKAPLWGKIAALLQELPKRQLPSAGIWPMKADGRTWIACVDTSVRLLFRWEDGEVRVLDILDRSDYTQ